MSLLDHKRPQCNKAAGVDVNVNCVQLNMYFVVVAVFGTFVQRAVSEPPQFRILAPPFVCPKDKEAVIDKPDNTVITLQTDAGSDLNFSWIVRWYPLMNPTQHFTVALWRTVRELEKQLNAPPTEPGVYVIDNTKLLSGVNYIFNVTGSNSDGEEIEKIFHIDNIKGDQKLFIEGRTDMFSILLVGGQIAYADIEYSLEALVTTCYKTHDYYFVWSVSSSEDKVDVSDSKGSRLEIKPNSLTPGLTYNVLCQVLKISNGEHITENGLPFRVLHRKLMVNFNVDTIVIPVDTPFSIQTDVNRNDYVQNDETVTWDCTLNDEPFTDFESDGDGTLIFPSGLPRVGEYLVTVTVSISEISKASSSIARVTIVEPRLPIIEVHPISRILNEGSIVKLKANVSNVSPGCSITWYFMYEKCTLPNTTNTELCTDHEHGVQLSDPIFFYSLEENFLSELTDFTNESAWKLVEADLEAASGIAKIVAECECNKVNNCTTEGTVYADLKLKLNVKPNIGEVLINPETGTAMETVFRLSTLAQVELHKPLRYTFYCDLGNKDILMIATYLEYLAVETLLPYVELGLNIWVEFCDSLGACSVGPPTTVHLSPGEARTVDALIQDAHALVSRCEIISLERLVKSTIVTYTSSGQTDGHTKFTAALLDAFRGIDQHCADLRQYSELLYWLARNGVDTSEFV